MRDELNEPLGVEPPPPSPFAKLGPLLLRTVAVVALVGLGALIYRAATPPAPRPEAVARVEAPAKAAPPAVEPPPAPLPPSPVATKPELENGVKVVRSGGATPSGLVIDVPTALGVRLAPAPDPRLIEKSRFGLLPRIGADGSRPLDVYARPIVETIKLKNAPRVALVVGGLGLDAAGTESALQRLPAAVTLGFAPYGDELAAQVARARDLGHEVLLQAPMEPFAGAAAPASHMLITAASETENRESLLWMLARFPGAIGVENYLGGKFTADSKSLAPVLAELASRGLGYLDDGSSPRSLAASLAGSLNLRMASADVVIDANATPDAIEAALTRLEGIARRQDGGAIGVATALNVSVDHIARFTDALEARGVALAPVSALLNRPAAKMIMTTP